MAAKRPVCAFDEATHTYTIDGVAVPSVSAILRAAGLVADYAGINPAVLAYAAERGLYAEAVCRLDDQGDLDEEAMHPAARGYLAAWRAFRRDHEVDPRRLTHQVRVYHPGLGYGGTIDVLAAGAVIDLKCTSKLSPTYAVQLAAYNRDGLVLEDGTPYAVRPARICVQLKPAGAFVMRRYEDPGADQAAFDAALTLYRWRHAGNNGKA